MNVKAKSRIVLTALVVSAVGCDSFGDLWKMKIDQDAANMPCQTTSSGGGSGLGGAGGAGIGGAGVGGDPVGAGGAFSGDVGAGGFPSDPGSGDPGAKGPGAKPQTSMPECAGSSGSDSSGSGALPPPLPVFSPPAGVKAIALTTTRLRDICRMNGVGTGLTGILFNRACGLAFETWVLTARGLLPRWTTPIKSAARAGQTGGLPASVIPEQVGWLKLVDIFTPSNSGAYEESLFTEIKAVTGALTPGTSKYQILGLLDVAARSPAALANDPKHPPPVVAFITTGNTTIAPSTLTNATGLRVAVWQQMVFEDGNSPSLNPMLYLGPMGPMNPEVYGTAAVVAELPTTTGSTLTSPTAPPTVIPNDPDPPEVD